MKPEPIIVSKDLFESKFPKREGVRPKDVRMSNVSIYSVTRPETAVLITNILLEELGTPEAVITDAFANVGGMTIALASVFKKVNACELEPLHCKYLKHNLAKYGLLSKTKVYCGDVLLNIRKLGYQDAIFLDPPWGGPSYKDARRFRFPLINQKHHIARIMIDLMKIEGVKLVVLLCPSSIDLVDMSRYLKKGFWVRLVDEKRSIFLILLKY